MEKLKEMVIKGKTKNIADHTKSLLDGGCKPEALMKEGLIPAMDEVGDMFAKGEYFVPEMLMAAKAMKLALKILQPHLADAEIEPLGKVVVGTVKGDLHDIGKNLASIALEGAGFEVIDLGTDISPEQFVNIIKEHKPKLIGLSALLSTTMRSMKDTVEAIEKEGLRDQVKIMIGGAPVTQKFADEIGADFYAPDSTAGRNYARDVISGEA